MAEGRIPFFEDHTISEYVRLLEEIRDGNAHVGRHAAG